MKNALWITCGIRGNAGDALIYQTTRAVFKNHINLDFRYVSDPLYIRDGSEPPANVMIGPGGMLVQTNSSRHLHQKLDKQWDYFHNSKFHLWSTGILSQPSAEQSDAVRRITSRTSRIIVRANRETEFIREVDPDAHPEWAPCSSLFCDTLLDIPHRKRDVVAVNLDSFLFTEENFKDHPLRRFKAYAESEGLEVRSMTNASGDSNRMLLDLFPPLEIDAPIMERFLRAELEGREFNRNFNSALENHPSFGARYRDVRFAFGKRLHGWLPFLAFDVPAAFIGMHERRGMPKDYFQSNQFLCNVPRNTNMTVEQLDAMANAMIGKLNFFIHNEDRLASSISSRREKLLSQVYAQAAEFSAGLV